MGLSFRKNEHFNQTEDDFGRFELLTTSKDVAGEDFSKVIQIIDETGNEVNYTLGKFIEIFETKGLEGFVH